MSIRLSYRAGFLRCAVRCALSRLPLDLAKDTRGIEHVVAMQWNLRWSLSLLSYWVVQVGGCVCTSHVRKPFVQPRAQGHGTHCADAGSLLLRSLMRRRGTVLNTAPIIALADASRAVELRERAPVDKTAHRYVSIPVHAIRDMPVPSKSASDRPNRPTRDACGAGSLKCCCSTCASNISFTKGFLVSEND